MSQSTLKRAEEPDVVKTLDELGQIPQVFMDLWGKAVEPYNLDPMKDLASWKNLKKQWKNLGKTTILALLLLIATLTMFSHLLWVIPVVFGMSFAIALYFSIRIEKLGGQEKGLVGQMTFFLEWLKELSGMLGFQGSLPELMNQDREELERFADEILLSFAKDMVLSEVRLDHVRLSRSDKHVLGSAVSNSKEAEGAFLRRLGYFSDMGLAKCTKGAYIQAAENRLCEERAPRLKPE